MKLVFLCVLMVSFVAQAALITKPVGQVGDPTFSVRRTPMHFISSREVQLHLVVTSAREIAQPKSRQIDPLPVTSSAFAPQVVAVLRDWVVSLETEAFSIADVSADEQERVRNNTHDLIARSPFYKNLEFSEKEIREVVSRHLKARAFIQFKQASVPQVGDNDAEKYFNDNRLKFGDGRFGDYKETIKTIMSRQLSEQRLQEWYQALFRKYSARSHLQDL